MKASSKIIAGLVAILLLCSAVTPIVLAAESTDEAVLTVIDQLEIIDTLQQMQNKRTSYTASSHYDINTTNQTIITRHVNARNGYESYVDTMFAARIAAQQAYDALTPAQQAQIDPALVAKLNDQLDTVFYSGTYSVTPADNEYTFEAVNAGAGYGYEISNHMVSGNIPQTFVLVDTADGKTSWTPNGLYEYGKSNYEVAYCCDVQTALHYGSDYKRLNPEDSHYYSKSDAEHIRAIVMNAYPFLTVEQMKANLKANGLNAAFVDSLTRADMIAAVQQAIWTYANSAEEWNNVGYFATIDIPRNTGIYFTPMHDYTNECWDWFPGKRTRTFDPEAGYRVNNLVYYLCSLDGVAATDREIIISDVDITRANLVAGTDDTYEIGMYVHLSTGADQDDKVSITVKSYGADGILTDESTHAVYEADTYPLNISAQYGDTITVTVEGTQNLDRGVFFYEPEGGRDYSQCLVGVGGGQTRIRAQESFTLNADIDMGIRIYKTVADTGLPLSDITFDIYNVPLAEGETVGEAPTDEEIAKFATAENLVGSVITDVTGYAALQLNKGLYLVVEQHNTDKVKAPVRPFFIQIPMPVEKKESDEESDTEVVIEYLDIVSIYPKNEPIIPPPPPPDIPPPPDDVSGSFSIIKHDARDVEKTLSGASFQVFRTARTDDTNTQIIRCNEIDYAVVPVTINGENLILTTDENGAASSPQLTCGTYFLVETQAPKHYTPLEEAIMVTVESSLVAEAEVLYIENQLGDILPETGGMGTVLMIGIGSILAIIAVVFLVTNKRILNGAHQDEEF